ncbi:MAG: HD domain-containing protein [Hyphomicrobiaceae bacterium]|nr:HD domain-containing protein [Hyphomicrobiaceae bacterium]
MSAQDDVERCWYALTLHQGCAGSAAAAVLEELVEAYGEPHRHYHTLDHIRALLALLELHGHGAADPRALRLAILFHDVVYDPSRHDNEEASAAVAAERLTRLRFPEALVARVALYIVATRHDRPGEAVGDGDLALLLDLDLSILAAAPGDYQAYASAVRREYGFVPDDLYRAGRRRVLAGFLTRGRIYLTEPLRALWEEPARANLATERAALAEVLP